MARFERGSGIIPIRPDTINFQPERAIDAVDDVKTDALHGLGLDVRYLNRPSEDRGKKPTERHFHLPPDFIRLERSATGNAPPAVSTTIVDLDLKDPAIAANPKRQTVEFRQVDPTLRTHGGETAALRHQLAVKTQNTVGNLDEPLRTAAHHAVVDDLPVGNC